MGDATLDYFSVTKGSQPARVPVRPRADLAGRPLIGYKADIYARSDAALLSAAGKASPVTAPPPALDCAHAIEYAIVDDTVAFEQRHTLNVGGEWLGAVPQLAICQSLDETQFMVFHCDREWNVLGVAAGYKSVAEAKIRTENSYHGISAKWRPTGHSREEATRYVAEQFKDQECSFCGRTPLQYQSCVGDTIRICNHCINEFHAAIHRGGDDA